MQRLRWECDFRPMGRNDIHNFEQDILFNLMKLNPNRCLGKCVDKYIEL